MSFQISSLTIPSARKGEQAGIAEAMLKVWKEELPTGSDLVRSRVVEPEPVAKLSAIELLELGSLGEGIRLWRLARQSNELSGIKDPKALRDYGRSLREIESSFIGSSHGRSGYQIVSASFYLATGKLDRALEISQQSKDPDTVFFVSQQIMLRSPSKKK